MALHKLGGAIETVLNDLIDERAIVDEAIQKLQALFDTLNSHENSGKNVRVSSKKIVEFSKKIDRRTKKGKKAAAQKTAKKKASRHWSPAAKREAAERMRAYWAERRKQKASRA